MTLPWWGGGKPEFQYAVPGEVRLFWRSPWAGSKTLIAPSHPHPHPEDRVTHLIWGWGPRLLQKPQKWQRRRLKVENRGGALSQASGRARNALCKLYISHACLLSFLISHLKILAHLLSPLRNLCGSIRAHKETGLGYTETWRIGENGAKIKMSSIY